ncbi:Rid family detoxifying hydrolase [Rhizobium sp. CNPSo 3968]|uniref:Rid family detoxifying hydrolase n=1 Tax=Rhizobium sp. CNPSo 3968 TaxID=3021408 RepID=UPI00254C6C76|nr:Rid family detoxifying hydrolase [Rhizobium sp. CNPSo 3968]MDK4717905.1 Rid family detoxifying hydrolase [Rhizobium sp. CNPSo 3968]
MSSLEVVNTNKAPAAIGPYSQARIHAGLLFVSGQLPIDPLTGKFSSDEPAEQIRQCLANIRAIADAAGTSMSNCLKTTVLVTDLSQFKDINAAYGEAFTAPYPARATYQVAALPLGAKVEVEAVIALA